MGYNTPGMNPPEHEPQSQVKARKRWVEDIWQEYWLSYFEGYLTLNDLENTLIRLNKVVMLDLDFDKRDIGLLRRIRILKLVISQIKENQQVIKAVEAFLDIQD